MPQRLLRVSGLKDGDVAVYRRNADKGSCDLSRAAAELASLAMPAASRGRIHLIDGTLVSWYGPRIRRAIETLRPLLAGSR